MGLGVQRRVLTCGRQAMRHRPGLRLDRLPAQARQPGLTGNGLVGCAIVTNHAPADTQRLGRSTQGQAIAGHPAVEHLVADLVGLFLGPGVDVIRAEFLVNPLDAVAPLADVDTGEYGWIKDGGQCRMAAQAILNVNLQHLAGAPGGVPGNPPNLSGPLVRLGGMGLVSGVVAGLGAALNVSDERASHCEGPLMDEHRQGVDMQQQTANAA